MKFAAAVQSLVHDLCPHGPGRSTRKLGCTSCTAEVEKAYQGYLNFLGWVPAPETGLATASNVPQDRGRANTRVAPKTIADLSLDDVRPSSAVDAAGRPRLRRPPTAESQIAKEVAGTVGLAAKPDDEVYTPVGAPEGYTAAEGVFTAKPRKPEPTEPEVKES